MEPKRQILDSISDILRQEIQKAEGVLAAQKKARDRAFDSKKWLENACERPPQPSSRLPSDVSPSPPSDFCAAVLPPNRQRSPPRPTRSHSARAILSSTPPSSLPPHPPVSPAMSAMPLPPAAIGGAARGPPAARVDINSPPPARADAGPARHERQCPPPYIVEEGVKRLRNIAPTRKYIMEEGVKRLRDIAPGKSDSELRGLLERHNYAVNAAANELFEPSDPLFDHFDQFARPGRSRDDSDVYSRS